MKRRNYLVDCHCFDSNLSQGITTYIEGIYKYLPHIAKDINFYFVASNLNKIQKIFGCGDNIKYIPLKSKDRINRLFFEIPKIIKKYNIEYAHYQYICPFIKNCKTIVTLHDILFVDYPQYFPFTYRLFKGLMFKISARRADMLCTVSEYSREQISRHYKINKEEIVITPNAVSKEFYSINGDKPEFFPEKYILYVSRIEPRKNHIAIIKAFKRLKLADDNYNLVFIGKETVATPEFHRALNNLTDNIKKRIKVISQSSFAELKLWYKYASLFVYPSFAEGFGIPPIEAAAAEVPVICNNSTAMSEFSFLGKNLIDISDENVLDDRIIDCIYNKSFDLETISHKVKQIYDWKTIAVNFNNSLKKIEY